MDDPSPLNQLLFEISDALEKVKELEMVMFDGGENEASELIGRAVDGLETASEAIGEIEFHALVDEAQIEDWYSPE